MPGVPQWFDEGLAVVISGGTRYLASETAEDRRLVPPSGPLPVTLDEWLSAASKDAGTYAESACQVTRWLRDNGGRAGLLSLIERLNARHPLRRPRRTGLSRHAAPRAGGPRRRWGGPDLG